MKKEMRSCGLALIASLPAGCMPPAAEPLTEEEKTLVSAQFDDAVEHLDLLEELVSRTDQPLITFTDPTASVADLREHWEEVLDRGYTMLENNQIYSMSSSELSSTYQEGVESATKPYKSEAKDPKEYIIIDRAFLTTEYIQAEQGDSLLSVTVYELDHVIDPEAAEHAPEVEGGASFEVTQECMDVPYQDQTLFFIYDEFIHSNRTDLTDFVDGADGVFSNPENEHSQENFNQLYGAGQTLLDLAQSDPHGWSQLVLETSVPTVGFTPEPTASQSQFIDIIMELGGIHIANTILVDSEGIIEVLSSSAAEYMRKQSADDAAKVLKHWREGYPELYAEFKRQHLPETQVKRGPFKKNLK